jgi:hypothetical protein
MHVIHTHNQKLRRKVRLKFLEIRDVRLRSVFCAANKTTQKWKIVFVAPFSWNHALQWLQRHLHPAVSRSSNTSLQSCEVVSGSAKKFEDEVKKCDWTNLIGHLQSCVGTDYKRILDHQKAAASTSTTSAFLYA